MERDISLERIAVLIDADNTQLSKIKLIMDEISTYGRIVVKKAYGDWNSPVLKHWEEVMKKLAIKPEQQFAYTKGKNATDMALVIDAMDLLSTGLYDAYAIVCSDSDYTPLVIRLRESGVYVFGAGEDKTPASLINACDNFIRTKLLVENEEPPAEPQGNGNGKEPKKAAPSPAPAPPAEQAQQPGINHIHHLLRIACEKYQDDDGWVNVSDAGAYIKRVQPDFASKAYGHSKLSDLIKAYPKKYQLNKSTHGKTTVVEYRLK